MSDERQISFFVPGRPQQKGSTKSFRHAKTGKIVTMSANKNLKLWEATVRLAAREANGKREALTGAVAVYVTFTFERPRCDYGTGKNAGTLKNSAPQEHTKTPDIDKLVRGILDGLTGVLFRDDRQVAVLMANKQWGWPAGAGVTVKEITPLDGWATAKYGLYWKEHRDEEQVRDEFDERGYG